MKHTAHPKAMVKLSESTCRLLESYALAATAAGVGILAATSPSEAKVVYTPVHQIIKGGMTYALDLNRDGVLDFSLLDTVFQGSTTSTCRLSVKPARANGAKGFRTLQGEVPWASALESGVPIGGRDYFPGRGMAAVFATRGGGVYSVGSWVNVKRRYLGLKFRIGGKVHYGWARLDVSAAHGNITATLTGYAYETIPNKAIIAGETKGTDDLVPESGSLGALAAGAPAMSASRMKQTATTSH